METVAVIPIFVNTGAAGCQTDLGGYTGLVACLDSETGGVEAGGPVDQDSEAAPAALVAVGGAIGSIIYHALVRELGERLRPTARVLVQKIMDGTAGNVPTWGYEILACAPAEVMHSLVPHLADDNIVMRERATVALGYMGPVAAGAREPVAAALGKAPSERERRLLEWCLREIDRG